MYVTNVKSLLSYTSEKSVKNKRVSVLPTLYLLLWKSFSWPAGLLQLQRHVLRQLQQWNVGEVWHAASLFLHHFGLLGSVWHCSHLQVGASLFAFNTHRPLTEICSASFVLLSMAQAFKKNYMLADPVSNSSWQLLCSWDFSITNERAVRQRKNNLSVQLKVSSFIPTPPGFQDQVHSSFPNETTQSASRCNFPKHHMTCSIPGFILFPGDFIGGIPEGEADPLWKDEALWDSPGFLGPLHGPGFWLWSWHLFSLPVWTAGTHINFIYFVYSLNGTIIYCLVPWFWTHW